MFRDKSILLTWPVEQGTLALYRQASRRAGRYPCLKVRAWL